jgi:hypothetical protein
MTRWASENGPGTLASDTVTINFPMLVIADDYHEFQHKIRDLTCLGIRGLKLREIGCTREHYAVIYMHKLPKASEVVDLLQKNTFWSVGSCHYFIKHGVLPE